MRYTCDATIDNIIILLCVETRAARRKSKSDADEESNEASMQHADASPASGAESEAGSLRLSASDSAALLQQVLDQRGKKVELTYKEFGLSRWKEYAVLRHGNNARFQNSVHGRELIKLAALREYEAEVRFGCCDAAARPAVLMRQWLTRLARQCVAQMSQMHQQVRSLQSHVQLLEQELTLHKARVKEYEHMVSSRHRRASECNPAY